MFVEVFCVQSLSVDVDGVVSFGCLSPLVREGPDGVKLHVIRFVVDVCQWCWVFLQCTVHAWIVWVIVVVVAVVGLVLVGSVVAMICRPFVIRSRVVLGCMRAKFRKAKVDAVVLEVFS